MGHIWVLSRFFIAWDTSEWNYSPTCCAGCSPGLFLDQTVLFRTLERWGCTPYILPLYCLMLCISIPSTHSHGSGKATVCRGKSSKGSFSTSTLVSRSVLLLSCAEIGRDHEGLPRVETMSPRERLRWTTMDGRDDLQILRSLNKHGRSSPWGPFFILQDVNRPSFHLMVSWWVSFFVSLGLS